jgi:hypothetical protein
MAIMQGITGKLSGKMGSAVFRVRNGAQVVAQYNPIVKNPDTTAQQGSRAAFKLLSQLGAVLSPGFGTMGVAKRAGKSQPSKRNIFFQLNYPSVVVDTQGDVAERATIPMENVKLTSSTRYLGVISSDASTISVTLFETSIKTVRFVDIDYVMNGSIKQPVLVGVSDVAVVEGQASYRARGTSKGTVLAYGLIPGEGESDSSLGNLFTPSSSDYVGAVEVSRMINDGEITTTATLGINYEIIEG